MRLQIRPLKTAVVVAGMIAALAVSAQTASAASQRALLIGIGKYKNINNLSGPPKDVARVEQFLIGNWHFKKDEIAVLLDEKATRKGILRSIEQWLINSTRPGDRVVFYYSGHGGQVPDRNGDEKDGLDETLTPYDVTPRGDNQITDDVFGALLRRMKGRDVTVIIDSCFSGTISRAAFDADADSDEFVPRTFFPEEQARGSYDVEAHRNEESFVRGDAALRVWTAASSHQWSWDSRNGGIFTQHFVAGSADRRADANGNNIVTNAELLRYVREKTKAWCATNKRCRAQGFTPTLEAPSRELAAAVVPLGAQATAVTDVVTESNEAKVSLKVLPGDEVKLGEAMRFEVTSTRSGWLVLLDVNARGEVVQLIPNDTMKRHSKSRRISPNDPMTVPDAYYGFKFAAGEPTGDGTLVAIVTEDDVALSALLEGNGSFGPIPNAPEYLAKLAAKLIEIWTKDEKNRALRWSLATRKYRITE